MTDFSKLKDIYLENQECPSCSKDTFLALKKYPDYGRCTECSFDNEFEMVDKFDNITNNHKE